MTVKAVTTDMDTSYHIQLNTIHERAAKIAKSSMQQAVLFARQKYKEAWEKSKTNG